MFQTGGYKVSALEIEREILEFWKNIKEVAVLGKDDVEYGQIIVAIIVLSDPMQEFPKNQLNEFLFDRLAKYKVPREYIVLNERGMSEIPKNAMGKINKKHLAKILFDDV